MHARSLSPSPRRLPLALSWLLASLMVAGAAFGGTPLHYESPEHPASLAGRWRFHPGDDPSWASPGLDDGDWASLDVPRPWGRQGYRGYRGLAWYRRQIALGGEAAAAARAGRLALRLGPVDSAYELYLGGRRVGGVGSLPPRPQSMYDRSAVFVVPPDALGGDDRLTVAVRVWRSDETRAFQGGITNGPIEIGPEDQLERALLWGDLQALGLAVLFAVASLHHLHLYVRRRALREFLWFGLTALLLASYTFLRSEIKYQLTDDFRLLKTLEYVVVYLSPVVQLELFFGLFSRPLPKLLRAAQIWSGALAVGAAATPSLAFEIGLLTPWQLSAVGMIAAVVWLVAGELRRGHPEARLLAGGFGLLGVAVLHDIVMSLGWMDTPRLTPYGFAVFTLSMAALLAHRFARAYAELEHLNLELATRVREQTAALRERAAELETKNEQIEEANRHLRESSLVDPMTGLRNRRFYLEHVDLDVARVVREHEGWRQQPAHEANPGPGSLAFLLLDVDEFKSVNDRHGHKAGDEVLEQIGGILRRVCRESDSLMRWGGDEFLVVSRQGERAGAAVLAERLRSSVAAHDFVLGGTRRLSLTVSVGYACFPPDESEPRAIGHERALEIADACLYRVKASGRDGWLGLVRAAQDALAELRIDRHEPWTSAGVELAGSLAPERALADRTGEPPRQATD